MVFPLQPSKKKKRSIGRRQKQGTSHAAYQSALGAAVAQAQGVTENSHTPLHSATQNRKDDNWRSNRAVKAAKRATAKAIAERDATLEKNTITKCKLNDALSQVKKVKHEHYLERKTVRYNNFKTEEEHKFALSELTNKFYEDLDAAHAEVNIETSKRLAEEALRIEAVQALQDERQYHAGQMEKQKIKLTKERRGHALVIDHLHEQ